MAAANTDKFKKAKRKFSTTIAAGGFAQAATTLPLTSTTGLDTDTAIVLVIGAGTSAEEVVTGVVSGSNVINCVRGKEGTTDQAHSAGDTVTMYFTETHWDDVMDGILVQHKQDGTHANTITTDTINENTSANGVTIDSLNIKDGVLNSNASVVPNNLVASTGTSWAWQSWTPTWTNFTVGNGTVTAKYIQIGKTVCFSIKVLFGSTTSVTGSPPILTLPVTAKDSYSDEESICYGTLRDASGFGYTGILCFKSTTQAQVYAINSGNYAFVSSSIPYTWTTSDYFTFVGIYEAA